MRQNYAVRARMRHYDTLIANCGSSISHGPTCEYELKAYSKSEYCWMKTVTK